MRLITLKKSSVSPQWYQLFLLNLSMCLSWGTELAQHSLQTTQADQRELDRALKNKFVAFAKRGFEKHNDFRSAHHSPPLKWSDRLAEEAQKIAYKMALKGTLQVPGAANYGENRAKLSGVNYDCELAGEEATRIWFSQEKQYSYSDPRLNSNTDSFTQIVWKGTKELGMGCAQRKGSITNEIYVVALYNPAGNSPKGLRANVLSRKSNFGDVYASIFRRRDKVAAIKNK